MSDDLLDDEGYPTDAAVDRILNFEGTPQEFIDYIKSLWAYRLFGTDTELDDWGKPYVRFHLATGGWSGNETIIGAVEKTMFSFMFWESSRRGGAFEYRIRESILHQSGNWGEWRN